MNKAALLILLVSISFSCQKEDNKPTKNCPLELISNSGFEISIFYDSLSIIDSINLSIGDSWLSKYTGSYDNGRLSKISLFYDGFENAVSYEKLKYDNSGNLVLKENYSMNENEYDLFAYDTLIYKNNKLKTIISYAETNNGSFLPSIETDCLFEGNNLVRMINRYYSNDKIDTVYYSYDRNKKISNSFFVNYIFSFRVLGAEVFSENNFVREQSSDDIYNRKITLNADGYPAKMLIIYNEPGADYENTFSYKACYK